MLANRKNLILITMDEVRADHISCYGYKRISTGNIDSLARDGVMFRTCIASSVLTPVCHASILSGLYPYSHGMRGPFDKFRSQALPVILRNCGYRTAGFVGNAMLGASVGFNHGFDHFDEPRIGDDFMWELHSYKDPEHPDIRFPWGNWWIDRMIEWIEDNLGRKFFAFGHFFHTHEGSEKQLMDMGLIDPKNPNSEYGFYDEKIKLCDDRFVGSIIRALKKIGIYDDTTIVITADHGTTLGERPLPPIPWRENVTYPQHTTMYEPDIRVPLIIKDRDLPRDISFESPVKQVDIFPTLLKLLGIDIPVRYEGLDLYQKLAGETTDPANNGFSTYIEDLFLMRGPGALQAVRTKKFKYIINQSNKEEEFYDLQADPREAKNSIYDLSKEEKVFVRAARKEVNKHFKDYIRRGLGNCLLSSEINGDYRTQGVEKEVIMERLRALGYI
jgi:arylsulfatase A-like enzyme